MKVKAKVDIDTRKLLAAPGVVKATLSEALHDVGDDLVRASSGAAPHDTGYLGTKGWNKKVSASATSGFVEVSYYAVNYGFNYALKMHEGSYNLGPGSLQKPGGIGMSGTRYSVGPKYLERPLMGERAAYTNHINKQLAAALKALD